MKPTLQHRNSIKSTSPLPSKRVVFPYGWQEALLSWDAQPRIRLLLADDHFILRQALTVALSEEADLQIIGQANHGREAIELANYLQPDVILMDIQMPICNGVAATRTIHQHYPWIKILVLSGCDEEKYISQALQAGALNYFLKSRLSYQEIVAAVRAAYRSCYVPRAR
ncbi:MAG: response regulator transcription factor [Cyanobacteria bacterium CRU_2_1]|nr:response regulator transcription factor [Cyanobacteria bacterium RU_5_0]NJR62100.1 response regulator transcription factor [Cyanobacteria bacterium CRU_2_1]